MKKKILKIKKSDLKSVIEEAVLEEQLDPEVNKVRKKAHSTLKKMENDAYNLHQDILYALEHIEDNRRNYRYIEILKSWKKEVHNTRMVISGLRSRIRL